MLSDTQKQSLLKLARDVIHARLHHSTYTSPDDPAFAEKRGMFVTLHIFGKLRGCIGYIHAYKSILDTVKEMALAAAFRDPRFPPVQADELPDISIEISLLSPMEPVQDISEITIGRDGLYLDHPYSSGLLLPQVATEWNWDRDTFLQQVCRKAGLPDQAWQDDGAQLYRFSAEIFAEE
jgi:AmmeMemoRadiSam system protein A